MTDGKFNSNGTRCNDGVCIDTYRILDSCRDKDCYEAQKVYLTSFGQEIIDRTTQVRTKSARIINAYIDTDEVPFNNGFYQINAKLFVKLCCEACLGCGNIQDFDGLCVIEKKVILYGGEGRINIFKSDGQNSAFCPDIERTRGHLETNLPTAVIETVEPVVLDTEVTERCHSRCRPCCCSCSEIPGEVHSRMSGQLTDGGGQYELSVSLGLFSVVRIERPCQLLVNAQEYSVPEKECIEATDDNPCAIFRNMPFPVNEFSSTGKKYKNSCGC